MQALTRFINPEGKSEIPSLSPLRKLSADVPMSWGWARLFELVASSAEDPVLQGITLPLSRVMDKDHTGRENGEGLRCD